MKGKTVRELIRMFGSFRTEQRIFIIKDYKVYVYKKGQKKQMQEANLNERITAKTYQTK